MSVGLGRYHIFADMPIVLIPILVERAASKLEYRNNSNNNLEICCLLYSLNRYATPAEKSWLNCFLSKMDFSILSYNGMVFEMTHSGFLHLSRYCACL